MEKNKINVWQVSTIVCAALFLLAVFNVFSFTGSTTTITGNAVTYINENLIGEGAEAVLINEEKSNGLIKATLNIDGQVMEAYISNDGKLLFPGAIDITGEVVNDDINTQPSTGIVEVSAADGAFLGPEDSENVIVEFSDFECAYCGAAMGTHEGLVSQFKSRDPSWEASGPKLKELAKQGKIKLVFRHFPLSFHQNAMPAALASECANEQGKFWEYHDVLFENQETLTTVNLKKYASDLSLDTKQFNECLDSGKYEAKVQQDMADGQKYGVSGTPAFFVNGQLLSGAQPFSAFEQLLNL